MANITDVMTNLVREAYPANRVLYRTMSASYTGAQMVEEIQRETDVGKDYVSEVLRVCRDLISRQARREEATQPPSAPGS